MRWSSIRNNGGRRNRAVAINHHTERGSNRMRAGESKDVSMQTMAVAELIELWIFRVPGILHDSHSTSISNSRVNVEMSELLWPRRSHPECCP